MFANRSALELLVRSDTQATEAEKSSALAVICGRPDSQPTGGVEPEVVSFETAAKILGYKGARGVYRALHDGVLQGYYGGKARRRCTGITRDSINRALGKGAA